MSPEEIPSTYVTRLEDPLNKQLHAVSKHPLNFELKTLNSIVPLMVPKENTTKTLMKEFKNILHDDGETA